MNARLLAGPHDDAPDDDSLIMPETQVFKDQPDPDGPKDVDPDEPVDVEEEEEDEERHTAGGYD